VRLCRLKAWGGSNVRLSYSREEGREWKRLRGNEPGVEIVSLRPLRAWGGTTSSMGQGWPPYSGEGPRRLFKNFNYSRLTMAVERPRRAYSGEESKDDICLCPVIGGRK